MVKRVKCSSCGRMVLDHFKDERGVVFCWNCGDDSSLENVDIPEWIVFEASSIQKMGERYMIEIPQSVKFFIMELGEHIRQSKWKIQIKSQVR